MKRHKTASPPLPAEWHLVTGDQLKAARETLFRVVRDNPARSRLAARAIDALDALRCKLDDDVCGEFRGLPDRTVVNWYFGGRRHK